MIKPNRFQRIVIHFGIGIMAGLLSVSVCQTIKNRDLPGVGPVTVTFKPQASTTSTVAEVAHRGYMGRGASENTNDAIRHAIQEGFDGIEFDVRSTKDGRAVLLHDTTLDRTTTCTGSLRTYTLSALKVCDADNVSGGDFDAVPTYASVMDYIQRLSSTTVAIVHVKETLTPAFAAGLVKGARSLSNEESRVIFLAENEANFTTLKTAGWDQRDEGRTHKDRTEPGALAESIDVERVFWGVQDAAEVAKAIEDSVGAQGYFFYASGPSDPDAADVTLTPEIVDAIHANGDVVSAEPGRPQAEDSLRAAGVDALLLDSHTLIGGLLSQ